MKLIKERSFPLLGRKRFTYEVEHVESATPSKITFQTKVAKAVGVKPELVTIRHVFSNYGLGFSKVIAHVYDDDKVMKVLEAKKVKKEKKK